MAFDVKYVYQIIDKFSGPAAKINAAAKRINKTISETGNSVQKVAAKTAKTAQQFHVLSAGVNRAGFSFSGLASKSKIAAQSVTASLDSYVIPSIKKTSSWTQKLSSGFDNFQMRAGLAMGVASNKIKAFSRQAINSFRNTSVSIDQLQTKMAQFVAIAATAFILTQPIKQAMAFEDAMADVAKVVDFAEPDGLRRMSAEILNLSKITPVAAKDLAAIAAVGGQMGIAERDIIGFTDTVSKMSVAFGISADGAAVSMAKIANIFQIPAREFEKFADTINFISNNTVVSADEMLRALQNKGAAAGKQMGFTADQTAALSAAFVATGVNADRVGSLMQGLGRGMNLVAQDSKGFADILQKSPIKAMQVLSDSFVKLDDVSKKVQLQEVFGIDFAGRIGELLDSMQSGDGVVKAMFDLAASQEKVGSVNKEFQVRINTSASKMQIMKNNVAALAIKIGTQLLPVVNLLFDGISSLANIISYAVDATGPLIPMILAAATSLLTFKAVAIAAKIAVMALNFAMAANPIGIIIAVIASLVTWVAMTKEEFGGWTEAIIHVGLTIQKLVTSPIRLLLWALDKITGGETLAAFDKLQEKINKSGAEFLGFGEEFDRVMAKQADIAAKAEIATTVTGSASTIDTTSNVNSVTDVNVNLNDPSGAIKSVETKSKGPTRARVGQNMGLAYGLN